MPSARFESAAAYLTSASSLAQVSNSIKLELYGLFKYVTVSPSPNTSKPSIFDMSGRAKHDAWKNAAKTYTNTQDAEKRYLEIAKELGWTEGGSSGTTKSSSQTNKGALWDTNEEGARSGGSGLGLSVSKMAPSNDQQGEMSLHTFAVQNDANGIGELLAIVPFLDLDEKDEHGYTALHLAADRGHTEVVKLLLSHGVDTTIKDSDQLTALDLAKVAKHKEIVSILSA